MLTVYDKEIESIMVMDVKATSQQFADKTKASRNFWVKRVDFFEKKIERRWI